MTARSSNTADENKPHTCLRGGGPTRQTYATSVGLRAFEPSSPFFTCGFLAQQNPFIGTSALLFRLRIGPPRFVKGVPRFVGRCFVSCRHLVGASSAG